MGSAENFNSKVAAAVQYANRGNGSDTDSNSESIDRGQPETLPVGAGEGRTPPQNQGRSGTSAESPSRSVPVQNRKQVSIRNKALNLYEKIGNEFARIYDEESASKSYRYFLLELRKHQRTLVDGGIYTAKELDERVKELQSHLKEGGDEGKLTMADQFHRWLNSESEEPINESEKELLSQGQES